MSDPTLIQAQGSSPLTQYVDLLVRIPHELRDVLSDGKLPPSRVRQYWQKIEPAIDRSFREAFDEARKDGTAAAITGKLDVARDAVKHLLGTAYTISQGDGSESDFRWARSRLAEITSELMHRTRLVNQQAADAPDPTHHKAGESEPTVGKETERTRPTAPISKDVKRQWVAEAMLLVRDHPDWSNAEIARHIGKAPSTLSRSREFKLAAGLARSPKKSPTRGHITVDPDSGLRDVEAYSDDPTERDWDD